MVGKYRHSVKEVPTFSEDSCWSKQRNEKALNSTKENTWGRRNSPLKGFAFWAWCCRKGWLSSCCSWNCSCCCFLLLSTAARFCSCSNRCSSLASSLLSCLIACGSIERGSGGCISRFWAAEIHFFKFLRRETHGSCQNDEKIDFRGHPAFVMSSKWIERLLSSRPSTKFEGKKKFRWKQEQMAERNLDESNVSHLTYMDARLR